MAAEIIWRYEPGYSFDAFKATGNELGRYTSMGWLPKKSFGTRWGEFVLLTSPFIERIPRIITDEEDTACMGQRFALLPENLLSRGKAHQVFHLYS